MFLYQGWENISFRSYSRDKYFIPSSLSGERMGRLNSQRRSRPIWLFNEVFATTRFFLSRARRKINFGYQRLSSFIDAA